MGGAMSRVIPIKIKKHTPVRRPVSRYKLFLDTDGSIITFRKGILITDLYTNKEEQLRVWPKSNDTYRIAEFRRSDYGTTVSTGSEYKYTKGDWNETLKDMTEGIDFYDWLEWCEEMSSRMLTKNPYKSNLFLKPSIWQRLKEKLGGKR